MTLKSALTKIWKAKNEKELEEASREFTEGVEEFKREVENRATSAPSAQADDAISIPANNGREQN